MEAMALTESTYYILLSLYHPQHGYGIMQQTEQLSGGRVHLVRKRLDPTAARGKWEPQKRISADHRGSSSPET